MITVDDAYERYGAAVTKLPVQQLALDGALGRVTAADVASRIDLPPFAQSAMDGYALRAADTTDATPEKPARLRLVGTIPAGPFTEVPRLGPDEATVIYTGGHLPADADAVLRLEETRLDGDDLLVDHPVPFGRDRRERGEELAEGTTLAAAGVRLGPGLLGALAVAGVNELHVHREPRIVVLTTGDEVVPTARSLQPGEVFDGNAPLVASWLNSSGYRQVRVAHLSDDLDETTIGLGEALSDSDLVITTGGVSVGDRDFVRPAALRSGADEIFWRVTQKPGKPLLFSMRGPTPLIGLPGNPGAVFVCLVAHVRRLLDLMEGVSAPRPHFLAGALGFSVAVDAKRERWVRCRAEVDSTGRIRLSALPRQASHMISNLAHCTALARIPVGTGEQPEGSIVQWTPCADSSIGPEPGNADL